MPRPLEKEFKLRLTATNWKKLGRAGKPGKTHQQVNHYFDVLPKLPFAKQGIGIRIRQEDKVFLLTVKMPSSTKSSRGFSVKEEWECRLPPKTARAIVAGKVPLASLKVRPVKELAKKAKALPLAELSYLGAIKNRRVGRHVEGLSLELDRTEIFGKVTYEGECETVNPARDLKILKAVWRQHGIPFRPESTSKLARFLKALRSKRRT